MVKVEQRAFMTELWRRYELLQQWAIEHWPDKVHPLTNADFVETRKELLGLRNPGSSSRPPAQEKAAEPSEGGAQYVNVTPAPWP